MKDVHRLPPGEVAHICTRLLGRLTPMTVETLEQDLAEIGWTVSEQEIERPVFWLTSPRHPKLIGRAEAYQSGSDIHSLTLGVTAVADELDGRGQAQLDSAAEYLVGTLPCWLPSPRFTRDLRQSWSGITYDVEIGRDISQVSLIAQRRKDESGREAIAKREYLSVAEGGPSALLEGEWTALSLGLGRLAGRLGNLDVIMLGVGDFVSMDMSRDDTHVWMIAAEEEGMEEPTGLSDEQTATLAALGFHPPLGGRAEYGPQRKAWWSAQQLPLSRQAQETLGRLVVAALRQVYGARRPDEIMVSGPALSVEAQRVVDSLEFEAPMLDETEDE